MKAVIPVAGAGTSLRPHTHTQPKPLVPIAGRPILGHIIEQLLDVGITELIFIKGYLGDKIEEYVKTEFGQRIDAIFVPQDEPREGSAHALWVAKEHLKDEQDILIMLGDTIVEMDLKAFIRHPKTVLGIKKVPDPSLFGIATLGEDRTVKSVVEKPKISTSNWGLVGIYKIHNTTLLLESIEKLMRENIRTANNEFTLTDAIMEMIHAKETVAYQKVFQWYDCSQKKDLLQANETLLKLQAPQLPDASGVCRQTILIPPVSIGEGCQIEGCILGPNVTIGAQTKIHHSVIENSIIGSFSTIQSAILSESIIGNDSTMTGFKQSLNIGDNTEINFN